MAAIKIATIFATHPLQISLTQNQKIDNTITQTENVAPHKIISAEPDQKEEATIKNLLGAVNAGFADLISEEPTKKQPEVRGNE